MAKCLVNEVSTLLKSSSILEVTSVYFGGGESKIYPIRACVCACACVHVSLHQILVCYNTIFVCCSLEGTPSLAEPGTVSAVVEEIAHCVHLPSDAEICLEANPTSAEVQKLRYGYF